MKKYILKEDDRIWGACGEHIIPKGTILRSDGNIDEDGGMMCVVVSEGNYQGMEIIFSVSELAELEEIYLKNGYITQNIKEIKHSNKEEQTYCGY